MKMWRKTMEIFLSQKYLLYKESCSVCQLNNSQLNTNGANKLPKATQVSGTEN